MKLLYVLFGWLLAAIAAKKATDAVKEALEKRDEK